MVGTCVCVTNGSFAALSDELGLPLRRDRDFDGLVDELQLLGFQALSEPSAPVVSQRLVCHSCCSRAASVDWLKNSGCFQNHFLGHDQNNFKKVSVHLFPKSMKNMFEV